MNCIRWYIKKCKQNETLDSVTQHPSWDSQCNWDRSSQERRRVDFWEESMQGCRVVERKKAGGNYCVNVKGTVFKNLVNIYQGGTCRSTRFRYQYPHQRPELTLMKESEESWKIPSDQGVSQVLLLIACLIPSGI